MRILLLALPLAACAVDPGKPDPVASNTRCLAIEDRSFTSVDELECGLGPTGPASCSWHVAFDTHDELTTGFDWAHSDVAQAGTVQCDGATVLDQIGGSPLGSYDDDTGRLIWLGDSYTRD